MIPKDVVNKLKKEYTEIYAITYGDVDIIYRPLTKKEFMYVVDRIDKGGEYNVELEEEVVGIAVLYGDTDSLLGGSVSDLATKIVESSGFSNLERQRELVEKYREDMDLLVEQAEALVSYVFSCSSQDVDSMTFNELMHKFVQAEYILNMYYSHMQGAMAQQGIFKLTFPWEDSPKRKMENPTPMMSNQKKMTLSVDQLQDHGIETSTRRLKEETKKMEKATAKKDYFNWHEDI